MTDTERHLLRAITGADLTDADALRSRWADDTPRLALADYLDETAGEVECPQCRGMRYGFPGKLLPSGGFDMRCNVCSGSGRVSDGRRERAEFIRVQCELARLGETQPHCSEGNDSADSCDDPECPRRRWSTLRRRERELFVPAALDWLPLGRPDGWGWDTANMGIVADGSWFFRRGFVSALTLSWQSWLQHHAAIRARQPIERCKFTTAPNDDECIEHGAAVLAQFRQPSLWAFKTWPGIAFELPADGYAPGQLEMQRPEVTRTGPGQYDVTHRFTVRQPRGRFIGRGDT